jgi:hypothetical protein
MPYNQGMVYSTQDGKRIDSDAPADVLAHLASNAFGGPFDPLEYAKQLAARTTLYSGLAADPDDPAAIVSALVEAKILEKV